MQPLPTLVVTGEVSKSDVQLAISDQLCLDTLPVKIRAKTVSCATMKQRINRDRENELENTIFYFEKKEILTEQGGTDSLAYDWK